MRERKISEQEIEDCLANHDTTYPAKNDDDCMNYVHTNSAGRRIRVVVNNKNPRHRIIVSVMD